RGSRIVGLNVALDWDVGGRRISLYRLSRSNRAPKIGVRVGDQCVESLPPAHVQCCVCRSSELNVSRRLRICQRLDTDERNIVKGGMQLGRLRARDVAHPERTVHGPTEHLRFEVANFSVTLLKGISGADVAYERVYG